MVSPAMVGGAALWQGGGYGGRRAAFIGADRLGAELGGAHQPPPSQHQHHHVQPRTTTNTTQHQPPTTTNTTPTLAELESCA